MVAAMRFAALALSVFTNGQPNQPMRTKNRGSLEKLLSGPWPLGVGTQQEPKLS